MKLSLTATYWRAKWCSILLVFFATFISAQTTLVNYQFSGNLNPDAGALGSPVLEYKNTAGINTTPTFPFNRLQALASSHYLELSINATGASNLALSFNAYFISSVVGYGSWQVYANTGAGNTFASIGSIDLLSGASLENNGLFSEGLPVAASGKSDLKVRIISDYDGFGTNYLRIDNLKLVHGTPKCGVFTDTDVAIATGSDAAEATNTVFASTQTNTVGELKNYRIRNWYGTAGTQLTIDSIAILPSSGTTKYDFVIESSNNLTNIEDADYIRYCSGGIGSNCFLGTWIYSEYGTFGIRFSPKAEGVRKALVRIYSNGVPSPYEFYVIGGGRSCSSTSKDYVTNTTVLNLSNPTLYSNLSVNDLIGGTTNAPNPAVFTKLYPLGSSPYNPLYTSSTSSWYAKETAKTITYGGDDGIDISNLRNVTVEFNVAVFGSVDTSDTTLDGYGVTNNDFVILEIEDGTDNWVNVMRLNGSNNSRNKRRYVFNSTGMQLTKTYARPATLTTGSNSGNTTTSNAYARFQLTLPLSISSELTNFRFRITAKGNTGAVWLIDDVRIKSDAADYTIYNGSTWSNGELGETKKVIFDAPYTFTNANTTICACEITENGSVTLNSGINLTVKGLINNKADANHFLIADGANLIQ